MPGKVKVKIVAGRNLPVMDRSSDTTDAYVEVKLGNTTFKTDVCRKSLNPQWNSEWYRFEMDDAELQDEPLQIRLMDHDTYSANDAIGKVYLDLNPLLLPPAGSTAKAALADATNSLSGEALLVVPGNTMSGWFPVYDTMHGIRGEVNVIVKVELFSDFNKFRQSSCGVQFFNSSTIPAGYQATVVHGMVEELVVSDDPEYKWIDKIRTPRASNEARQTLFFKLSGEVQRRIGLKVLDFGGNAVIGYLQCFDLEAECGIVVRGLGTAVTLVRVQEPSHPLPCHYAEDLDNQIAPVFKNPVLSVIPASPLRQTPLEVKHVKGFLAPGSPKPRRSKSPQLMQPFSEYKPKRLGSYARSFSDNVPPCDNVSLKVLFEQEDMRGETVSSHKKIFERLSSFPKRKFRALRSNSTGNFSKKIPFIRSKSDNVASSLIRSIMDPNAFLDRVPEGEEGESRHSDADSVIHALRYEDGHLVPISSSSSDSSDSDVGDISDVSSMSSTSKEYTKIETDRNKCLKALASINKSTSIDNSMASSKTDEEVFEKDGIKINNSMKPGFASSVHVVLTPDNDVESHQYSSLVKFKDSPSPPPKQKNVLTSLLRQDSFDVNSENRRKRSDTPPLSEMDPFMKFSFEGKSRYKETFYGSNTPVKRVFKQPSLDDELKSCFVTNLSYPESVRHLPTVSAGHLTSHRTVHTIDVSDRSSPVSSLVGSVEQFESSVSASLDVPKGLIALCSEPKSKQEDDVDKAFIAQTEEKSPTEELPKTNDTVDKILNNPFKFPTEAPIDKITLIAELTQQLNDSNSNSEELSKREYDLSITQSQFHESGMGFNVSEQKLLVDPTILTHKELSSTDEIEYIIAKSNSNIESKVKNVYNEGKKDDIEITKHDDKSETEAEDSVAESKPVPVLNQELLDQQTSKKNSTDDNLSESSVVTEHLVKNNQDETILSTESNLTKFLFKGKAELKETKTLTDGDENTAEEGDRLNTKRREEKIPDGDNNTPKEVNVQRSECTEEKMIENPLQIIYKEQEPNEPSKDNIEVKPQESSETVSNTKSTTENKQPSRPEGLERLAVENSVMTNRYETNLTPPLLPLVKSRSATGLVEPCSVPTPRTVPEDAATPGVVTLKSSQSPIKFNHNHMPGIHRRSSDSDLSITPKGNSLTSSGDRSSNAGGYRNLQPLSNKLAMKKEPLEVMEFPFLTMMKFPPGFVVHIAGTVTSRSVKLLERVANQEEPESRDAWWKELRLEVRSHMKAMSCNAVIGYSENTTICDDVCVLSASGTAAVVNVKPVLVPPVSDTPEPPVVTKPPVTAPPISAPPTNTSMTTSLDRTDFERTSSFSQSTPLKPDGGGNKARHHSDSLEQPDSSTNGCALCHLPFNPASVPLPMSTIRCAVCSKRKVPDLLLATVEPLEGLPVIGRTCLIHVCVTRPKQHARGELNACVVSDSLPFIEYDIYKQLVNKLKVNGMNAVFGLKTQICLGEKLIAAVTSGTAVYLEPLPPPSMPSITAGESCAADSKLATVLRGLQDTVRKNREFYQVKTAGTSQESGDTAADGAGSDTEDSDDDLPDMDLHAGNKEACVFMVDDEQDMEAVSQLIDPHPPEGFFVTATETLPGLDELEVVRNLQMFTQIWRSRLPATQPTSSMHKHFHRLLQGIYYKLRRMTPCAVGNIKFRLALPEPDEMQISIVGMAVGLGEMIKNVKSVRRRAGTLGASSKPESLNTSKKSDDGDMIFSLEEDQESNSAQSTKAARPKSPRPTRQSTHLPPRERYGVDLTPLSYVPGGHIERYLGNLNFFFIRETSCIREGGGMSGFVHSFVAEVLAIIRAHVTALGGNAMVAFFLNECIILNNPHKNHGQCLINVGGDAVSVSYVD
ncbi:uncharacterized protein LOC128991428 isoform X2 [Macrosteles quadrilineatus]|uniref:uncharacterized protein LOC128991428 isoform X2 n=1 Tax=Macrosteles quadrilineatus TaxID=74068 RepID=UPI0023E2672B|nr:uncharacterized protein LOC128991428 isoform X2 [Macrosteles quadrilineatus]